MSTGNRPASSSSSSSSSSSASLQREEMKRIDEEFKVWKKNTPFLYDVMMSHALEWPSLSVQWLPDRILPVGCDYSIQRLLLGTHTSDGEQNYIHIAEVRLPLEDTDIDARAYEKSGEQPAAASSSSSSSSSSTVADIGGYASTYGKVEIVQSIPHNGEVHRARVMPQRSQYIATKSPSAEVLIFDRSLHPAKSPLVDAAGKGASSSSSSSSSSASIAATPEFRLLGHSKEGYGLSWSSREVGHLLSGSEDMTICFWDLSTHLSPAASPSVLSHTVSSLPSSHTGAAPRSIAATSIYRGHTDVVEDVAWSPHHSWQFASAGDDKLVILWDRRMPDTNVMHKIDAHTGEVNCIAYNPTNPNLLLSGSSDRTLALWDVRNLSSRLHSFEGHTDQITSVEWSPFSETICASASSDRRVHIWDLARIGREQEPEDAEDGPPELMFIHGGHTDKIVDFGWNQHEQWVLASVADDNTLQVWQPAESIIRDEEDDDEDEEDEQAATDDTA